MKNEKEKPEKENLEILIGDLHFGENNNSKKHNEHLIDFIGFVNDYAEKNKIKRITNLGDYFHQRDKINVETCNFGVMGAELIKEQFGSNFLSLKGNHDLYFKDSRNTSSLSIIKEFTTIVEDWIIDDLGNLYCSWLCSGEEYDEIVKLVNKHKPTVVCGHFEFSNFKMNDHYIMEHGQSHRELKKAGQVFSSHYHMRQKLNNVQYIGSPFPFNLNDANDTERGFAVMDRTTGEYEFVNYNKVKVFSIDYKTFMKDDEYKKLAKDPDNTTIRVTIEDDLENETLDLIKHRLEDLNFNKSSISYTGSKKKEAIEQDHEIDHIMDIDETVLYQIDNMVDVKNIEKGLLKELYSEAKTND